MPKYLDSDGVAYLWGKLKNNLNNKMIYYSKKKTEWDSDKFFISEKNVIYIYSDYKTIERQGKEIVSPGIKIGDGTSYLIDLPFLDDSDIIGMDDYEKIINHPYINGREVIGNKTGIDYNLQDKMTALTVQEIEKILYVGP